MKTNLILSLLITLSLALSACGGGGGSEDAPQVSGDPCNNLNFKITNGQNCSNQNVSPVALLALFDGQGEIYGICSGTMITANQILTAAHCLENTSGIVALVADDAIAATAAVSNPLYDGEAGSPYDIAVLTLESNSRAKPVAILGGAPPSPGQTLTIFGYGETNDPADTDNLDLHAAFMKVAKVTEGDVLANYDSTGSSICLGDSGGPAIIERDGDFIIAAVATAVTAKGDCESGSTAIFASVSSAVNFAFITNNAPAVKVK